MHTFNVNRRSLIIGATAAALVAPATALAATPSEKISETALREFFYAKEQAWLIHTLEEGRDHVSKEYYETDSALTRTAYTIQSDAELRLRTRRFKNSLGDYMKMLKDKGKIRGYEIKMFRYKPITIVVDWHDGDYGTQTFDLNWPYSTAACHIMGDNKQISCVSFYNRQNSIMLNETSFYRDVVL